MASVYETSLVIVSVYGVATLVAEYDGAFNVFVRLRAISRVFKCNVCMTPYFALIAVLALDMSVLQYFAIVGGSMILARNL